MLDYKNSVYKTDASNLLTKALNGDNDSFILLLQKSIPICRGEIKKNFKLSDPDLDDLEQKVSLKAWKNLKSLKSSSSFHCWLSSIFKNECRNFLVSKNRIEKIEKILSYSDLDDEKALENIGDVLQDAADAILQKKEDIEIYKSYVYFALEQLDEKSRNIVELVSFQDKTYGEAATILKIPLGSVMSGFYYAKKKMKETILNHAITNRLELPNY